jgi:C-terminal processing protease CtpA/Prc
MKIKHGLQLAILSASIAAGFSHAEIKTNYLSNVRPLIKFNELTRSEKVLLAQQSQLLLRDLYVNRYQKNEFYGTNPNFSGHVDPALKVQAVVNKIDSLSTTDLHKNLSQIFVSQRDLHLNYNFPLPHAAFISFLPFNFTRTASAANQNEVRISSIYGVFFDVFFPDQRKPKIGDQVIEYDGVPIKQAVDSAVINGNGANLYAGFSRALQYMTFSSQAASLPPAKDRISLKLKSASNGEEYSITIPWMSQYDDADLAPGLTKTTTANSANINALAMSNEPIQERYNQFVERNLNQDSAAFAKQATTEPSIKWSIVNRGDKKVGYISIGSFVPSNVTDNGALAIIANLLRNQLASTDALVVDVRNNGGGSIVYADKLPQMFMPGNASTNSARLLNTPLNFNFLNQDIFKQYWPNWVQLITDAQKTGNRYSKTGVFTTAPDANSMGQMYYKPVGVLANARSYSATDLFTCAMQDNGAATIFGEDKQTGAGGANVLEHAFFNAFAPEVFPTLPGGVSMRISWRQSIRSGYNNGSLIEDHGCVANVEVPRSLSDLTNGDQTQFDKIADALLAKTVNKSLHRFLAPVGNILTIPASTRTFNLEVANTEHVKVYVNNVLLKSHYVGVYGNPRAVTLSLPVKAVGEQYQIAFVGTDAGQTPLWNTKRMVNVTN